jgi:hypothetical protein
LDYCLKTKSANEIAEKFIDFISLVSPVRSISHDRGREFLNKNPKDVDYDSLLDDECMEIIHHCFINDFKILKY